MSYDLHFSCNGERCELAEPADIRGGTYALGGTREAWLNITYNYAPAFCAVLGDDGIRSLYGMEAPDVMLRITDALIALIDAPIPESPCSCHGTMKCYWAATKENARKALVNLYQLATLVPRNAILEGD